MRLPPNREIRIQVGYGGGSSSRPYRFVLPEPTSHSNDVAQKIIINKNTGSSDWIAFTVEYPVEDVGYYLRTPEGGLVTQNTQCIKIEDSGRYELTCISKSSDFHWVVPGTIVNVSTL